MAAKETWDLEHDQGHDSTSLQRKSHDLFFSIDHSSIPTSSQDDQIGDLYNLDVNIYEQEVFEKEILHQVDEALEKQKQRNVKVELTNEKEEGKNLVNKGKKPVDNKEGQGNDVNQWGIINFSCNAKESEMAKKIRMGEMTPFGTSILFKPTEVIHSKKVEKISLYENESDETYAEQKGKVNVSYDNIKYSWKKKTFIKNSLQKNEGRVLLPTKRKRKPELRGHTNGVIMTQKNNTGKSVHETTAVTESSCSEYFPTESEFSDQEECKRKTTLKRKKRKTSNRRNVNDEDDWNPDESVWLYSDDEVIVKKKSKSVKKETDDGDLDYYLRRLSDWEKKNSHCQIETHVKNFNGGFKIPLIVWNKLFNYQKVGVQWLWELHEQRCGGILGDEMGLGKTVQVIAFFSGLSVSQLVSKHGSFKGLGPVLVICPTTVMHQWVKELHEWWPQFRAALMHESGNFSGKRSKLIREICTGRGILITSFANCVQHIDTLTKYLWHYVVIDEGHKIRNPDSQIASAVKQLRTPHRLILSGSPMQNNLKELWSLFDFIFPGKLGTLPVFLSEFAVPITQGGFTNATQVMVATAFKCATVLKDTISPYLLRRVKEDVKSHINLPMKNEQILFCKLTDEQRSLYLEYLNSSEVDSIVSGRYKVFVGLLKLRKICNHPHLYSGGPKIFKHDKIECVAEEESFGYWKKAGKMIVVETLLKIWKRQDHRVLIFTQGKQMLHILENFIKCQGYRYLKLDGSTNISSRQPLIRKFNEDRTFFIFLSTTHVGGLGVNLTGADRVVIYDPDWNPATDSQARERAWRIGQSKQVTIYRLVTSGTIEEKIYHRQIFKQFLTNKILKDPRQRRFFKSNDLYELFTLNDTDKGSTETSALFAGLGSEIDLKRLSHRMKSQNKIKKPNEIAETVDACRVLSKEKIDSMKKLAKLLSQKISNGAVDTPGKHEPAKAELESLNTSTVNNKTPLKAGGLSFGYVREAFGRESRNNQRKDVTSCHRKRKKKERFGTFEGETVPHLINRLEYKDYIKHENEYKKEQDDYILGKLFAKSGIKTALQHDRIMEEGPSDYALVEGEAERVAKEAVRALKESRRQYFEASDNTAVCVKPRFGAKSRKNAFYVGNVNDLHDDVRNKKVMSSSELLSRIRERNRLLHDNLSDLPMDHSHEKLDLLSDIRNFISFEAQVNNMASTQEIIDRFRDRLPQGTSPLFRALLLEICEFHRNSDGQGIWKLRQDFKCSKDYMISPSETDTSTSTESEVTVKKKILPIDLKMKEDVLDARKALKKLQNLLKDKLGRNFLRRQDILMRAIVRGMPLGFLMEDIASVTEVLECLISNSGAMPECIDMIKMILKVAVHPPRVTKSSERIYCKKELSSYFTVLGELLATIDDADVHFRVLEIFTSLLCRPTPVDVACIESAFCHAAIEDSLLPYTLTCLLETVPDEFYVKYLNICLQIALVSEKACVIMGQNGAIEYVLRRLHPDYGLYVAPIGDVCIGENKNEENSNDHYRILDTVGHIMWIFLNNVTGATCESPSQNALRSLRYTFHAEANKQTEKSIATRNNLASIILKLYTVFGEKLPFVQSGFAVDIAMLAVATEIGTEGTWAKNINFGTTKSDHSLKEMMMLGCCILAKDENMLEILREQRVLEGVLRLINPQLTPSSVSWSPSQFIILLVTGLAILAELVPHLPDVFITNEGSARLLSTLQWFMGEHFDKLPLLETLKTLCALTSFKNNRAIIEDLKREEATTVLLKLCFYLLDSDVVNKENQEKLARIFFILEKLCGNERKIQTCPGNLYVGASIKFLTRITKSEEVDSRLEPKLLLCFSAFLWEAVVWCRTLLTQFTELNGINLVLDLIEISPYPVQILLLGLVVDIADEGENITQIITWRGRDGYGILNTMIQIWRKEELLYMVPRTENGCIADVERALMSEEQWYLTHCIKRMETCSPAIAEMMCEARPKIHSLYRVFRERYGDLTKLNESLYSVSFGTVHPQNQVYIPLIEHFFTLKLGEIWYETYREVMVGGLVPTLVDGETLRKLMERKREWAYRLKVLQEEIVAIQKLNSSDGEGNLYKLIRSCCMTNALDALHELDFIARTTYKDVEVKRKDELIREIDGSLNIPLGIDESHVHRSILRNNNVTCICGKYVWFKSEREVVPENSFVQPVSPNSSSC